jgi:Holliday junction DNA helicase RuvA
MYSYLRGIYKGHSPGADGSVVLEVGGIGYELFVPPIVDQQITATHKEDEPLLLYVSAQSGRDQPWPVLFGFCTPRERAFWELLISVPRVGGKLAARAMVMPVERIAEAIQQGERAFLDSLPGITLEGADKMIASLRKKVGPFVQPVDGEAARLPARVGPRSEQDEIRDGAVQLLMSMGLKRPEAQRGVDRLLSSRDDLISIQDIIVEFFRSQRT